MRDLSPEYLIDLADRLRSLNEEIKRAGLDAESPLRMATAADKLAAEKLLARARHHQSLTRTGIMDYGCVLGDAAK